MLTGLLNRISGLHQKREQRRLENSLPQRLAEDSAELERRQQQRRPRILVVKQDVNEDLYCCPPGAGPVELIQSTLLRTGPVALFTDLNDDFRIVQSTDDPECQVWQERATALNWDTLEFFSSYREHIPGRDYGQSRWAVPPEAINWDLYDIVISMDVCVPQRITRQFPQILWSYYVREIKAPSYKASLQAPAAGQDVVLNHYFRLQPPRQQPHVLEFPYHLQRAGCFHQLFGLEMPTAAAREGVFVDHHTMVRLNAAQRKALHRFGPVASTIHEGDREIIPTSEQLARRTMDEDLRERLLNSRFFLITPGQRLVFGTALVEAIAAGCLAIGNPHSLRDHGFMLTPHTAAADAEEAVSRMQQLNDNAALFHKEVIRQQQMVEYLCCVRPLLQLLDAWKQKCG